MVIERLLIKRAGLLLLALLLPLAAACDVGGDEAAATPTLAAVEIVWPLATPAPTATLSPEDQIATLTAVPPSATPNIPTRPPSPTPYVGIFLGEALVDPFEPVRSLLNPAEIVIEPTPTPGGVRLLCPIAQGETFGDAWRGSQDVVNALRCPIQVAFGFEATVQVFERGAMFLRPDTGEVWALAPGAGGDGRYWYVGRAPEDASLAGVTAPPGFSLPQGPLAAVWAGLPQVGDAVGFALQPPQPGDVNVQRYAGGSLFLDFSSGQVYALLLDGSAVGPFAGDVPTFDTP